MNRITLGNQGNEVRYEYRENCNLLLFCNFNDSRLAEFADHLHEGCSQIKEVKEIKRYDIGAAIIVTMHTGYNAAVADAEIRELYEYYFLHHVRV
jgi:hypothetical protein